MIAHADVISPRALSSGWLQWFWDAPPSARRSLLAAWLGWLLDSFDVMLYALVVGAVIRDFSLSTATAGLLGSLTLIASGIGGILFGMIADRYGRRPALSGSLLVYSVFTFACGLSTTVWQLGLFRFLLGLGMGGEWTSGAALVSETWPDRDRAKAMGLMQSAWSVGYAAAALVVFVILPRLGWRAVFFIGILPAVGRMLSALAPFVVGLSLAQTRGFGAAFELLAFALLAGAATWIWLPESRGWDLVASASRSAAHL